MIMASVLKLPATPITSFSCSSFHRARRSCGNECPDQCDAQAADEAPWRKPWDAYAAFYEAVLAPEITTLTWQRILDPHSPIIGRIAEDGGEVIGFSVSVLHEGTWAPNLVCYLEDLFVDPEFRGNGAGGLLIQDLLGLGNERKWSGLYWHTRAGNPARRLYDEFIEADDFVRYRIRI